MSYYNQPPNPYGGAPPSPYGIAPPLQPNMQGFFGGAAPGYPGYPQQQPGAGAYGAYPGAAGYPAQYGAGAYPQAGQQQQGYYNQATSYPGQPGAYGGQGYPAQGYGIAPAAGNYAGPQYSHHIVPGVQTDAYGLPYVPGDVTLQYAQTFRVEEKVLSATHDSFVVRDQQGQLRYKVDGSFTINERKTIRDIHGQTLLKLKEARLKMRDRITIFNPANVPVLTMQKTSAIQIGTKRVNGYIGAHPKGAPDIVITGNHNNTHFRIVNQQNQEIGEIRRRKFSAKNILTDQDTYDVTVHVGSPALVCFLAVVLDEIYED